MDHTETLVGEAADRVLGAEAGRRCSFDGEALDFTPPFRRLSMIDAVSERVGEPVVGMDRAALAGVATRLGVETRPGAGAGVLIDALFSELIQPELRQPTFVIDYPIETSPLARPSRTRPGVVERFELFVAGTEIANAFSEQNDPDAQRAAFEAQAEARAAGAEETQPMDHDYVRALEYGMPPTGGVGIGIDRLVMLLTDSRSIRDVLLFPQLRPEEGRSEPHDDETVTSEPAGRA
jgi:lysyl-tRNA synthetase class 2